MKTVKFIICLLFGLMFINAGLNKFLNYMPMPEMTDEQMTVIGAFVTITWLMPLVGAMEMLGGLLFIFPKTRALGALVIFPVMVGIVLHGLILEPSGLMIALPFFAINLWMIADNWGKYKPMVA
ncbi:MauE/DoxX family redox-associated membrane protein [Sphingobacterium sp. SYP-B4668]|uniref:MauE/DoxX family redox-associated membrane protein n=1 Tax=Sphingobacterium sp. SYP-B4668 TaxID=2996035 RepID=UPI0022DDEB9E|nr:MauE/DoxX family redox-associated membrane protein [Sphingobacterium sp. SYP-B4668]